MTTTLTYLPPIQQKPAKQLRTDTRIYARSAEMCPAPKGASKALRRLRLLPGFCPRTGILCRAEWRQSFTILHSALSRRETIPCRRGKKKATLISVA